MLCIALPLAAFTARASEGESDGSVDAKGIIFDHLGDRYGWEVPFNHHASIPLPIIVRSQSGEWHIFSSARLEHNAEYEGFVIAT